MICQGRKQGENPGYCAKSLLVTTLDQSTGGGNRYLLSGFQQMVIPVLPVETGPVWHLLLRLAAQ